MTRKLFQNVERTAFISPCERYRPALGRHWNRDLGYVLFIGLNPSTADAMQDDPTIRRCMRFAYDWGYGGIEMGNIFDWRSTDPKKLPRSSFAVSDKNDPCLRVRAGKAKLVIAAWGAVPWAEWRIRDVFRNVFDELVCRWYCLGHTKDDYPRHPLYVPGKQQPELFW